MTGQQLQNRPASTRPQRLAVEIYRGVFADDRVIIGFNEATAISCGDLYGLAQLFAEFGRFNEATAISCGDPAVTGSASSTQQSFNEATAISCGDPVSSRRNVGSSTWLQRGHSD